MEGWRKVMLGAIIGAAGTIYATDEEARRSLPESARNLPDNLRSRFRSAVAAGREASSRRREEILHDLDSHGGGHRPRRDGAESAPEPMADEPHVPQPTPEDATEPIPTRERYTEGV